MDELARQARRAISRRLKEELKARRPVMALMNQLEAQVGGLRGSPAAFYLAILGVLEP